MKNRVVVAFVSILAGCSSSTGDANPGADASTPDASSPDVSSGADAADAPPDATGLACDLSALRAQFKAGASAFDLDCDGKTDWRIERDAEKKITKETVDLNEDGKPDMTWDYTSTPQVFERDDNLDGVIDHHLERTPGSAPSSWDVVESWDAYALGTLNRRDTYTLDPAEPTYRLLREDLDPTDGSWNTVLQSTVTSNPPKLDVTVVTPGTGGDNPCTDAQAKAIEDALPATSDSIDCLAKYDPSLAAFAKMMFASHDIQLGCGGGGCANSDNLGVVRGCSGEGCDSIPIQISIGLGGFNPKACGPMSSTIFHELMHYALGGHVIGDGTKDPNDAVYGCEKLCGDPSKPGTAENCAACLQTNQLDPRCGAGPLAPPECGDPTVGGYCDCDSAAVKSYPDFTECTVSCPSGIACFAAGCYRTPPPPKCTGPGAECKCYPCCAGACGADGKCP